MDAKAGVVALLVTGGVVAATTWNIQNKTQDLHYEVLRAIHETQRLQLSLERAQRTASSK